MYLAAAVLTLMNAKMNLFAKMDSVEIHLGVFNVFAQQEQCKLEVPPNDRGP